ncbi:MAG TPA: glycerophosphoryl diester phosphodiesterase membrane domain-containing protein, partial [Verrucomicrobiae bacterium]|nr:glycerophosphoryl diester phosphodiesterase membrane domain-containing protein [Verrucomicrobiae bacterium]
AESEYHGQNLGNQLGFGKCILVCGGQMAYKLASKADSIETTMYKIIGADQREYGPVSAEQLRQWIAEGRAGPNSMIRPDDAAEWKPLKEYPEFAEALGTPGAAVPTIPLAPTHGGLAPEFLERDYNLDIGQCLANSWGLLKGNFGLIFGGVAIYLLVQGGLSLLGQIPFIGILLSLVSIVVTGPLTAGVYYFLLKNARHQVADIGDVFAGFRICLGQLILGYVVVALFTGLAALPGGALIAYPIYELAHHQGPTGFMILWICFGFLILLIPVMYLSICWIFTLPLIIDRQMDFWPAMSASRKMVSKHWWSVFALMVVCGLLNIVGVVACCVGVFVSAPLAFGAMMYAYESIFSAPAAPTA